MDLKKGLWYKACRGRVCCTFWEKELEMSQNELQQTNFSDELLDPDPVTIAMGIFAAAVGVASLITAIRNLAGGKARDLANIRKLYFEADRALSSLTIGYQNIVNYYDDEIARTKMVQGEVAFALFRDQWDDLAMLRKAFVGSGGYP